VVATFTGTVDARVTLVRGKVTVLDRED
jgi:hypothetical protein